MGRYGREERSKFEGKKRKDGFSCSTVSFEYFDSKASN